MSDQSPTRSPREIAKAADDEGSRLYRIMAAQIRMIDAYLEPGSIDNLRRIDLSQRLYNSFQALGKYYDIAIDCTFDYPHLAADAAANSRLALADLVTLAEEIRLMLGDVIDADPDKHLRVLMLSAPPTDPSPLGQAQRYYLMAEAQAERAQAAAHRCGELLGFAQLDAKILRQNPNAEHRALADSNLTAYGPMAHEDTTRAHDAAQAAALYGTHAALIARNHPNNSEISAAGVMALAAAQEAAKALQQCLHRQRELFKVAATQTQEGSAPQ